MKLAISCIIKKLADKISQKELEKDLIEFFKKNPEPNDDAFHKWVKKKEYNAHKAETGVYKLVSKFVAFLTGGRSNEKNVTKDMVDSKQLLKGTKVEAEHSPHKDVAEKIAMDHLAESGDYYIALEEMEKNLKKATFPPK